MRWRIYYGDGSVFSNRDGTAFDAPAINVQVIAQESDNDAGRILMHGTSLRAYYCWRDDEKQWYCTDEVGFYDYMMLMLGPKRVLFGRTLRNEAFYEVMKVAIDEGLGL